MVNPLIGNKHERLAMAYDEKTAERVRRVLAGWDAIEKKMMGAICFMVNGSMCCGVTGAGVMVRVGPEAYQQMLTRSHVRPLELGGRRPTGFVVVDPAGIRTDAALTAWVQLGIEFVAKNRGACKRSRTHRDRCKAR